MSGEPVVVAGVGIVTPVGLSAAETAASVRAAAARFVESRLYDRKLEPFKLAEIPDDGLPEVAEPLRQAGLRARESRLLRIASAALAQCAGALEKVRERVPLIAALPEFEADRPIDGPAFLARLSAQAGALFDVQRSHAIHRGRAGGLAAVGYAADVIRQGVVPFALAGGIDTYRDPFVLGVLDGEGRVKSSANLDGFIPGEGAAFLLLASSRAAARAGLAPLATLSATAQAAETGHLYSEQPYRGDGLAAAVGQLVQAGAASAPIQDVYSSMNGERHWAKEWGIARLRSSAAFADGHGMHHPADCFGDIGAAVGPAMIALAALGIRGGYRRSPALVYASSDRGGRAALVVQA